MEQRTRNHLTNARRNHQYSDSLLAQVSSTTRSQTSGTSAELIWCVVAAFYSAVRYVNAYLYEKHNQYVPRTHTERERLVFTDSLLKRVSIDYRMFKSLSIQARYDPLPTITEADGHDVLAALDRIAELIYHELQESAR
jgi:hypothetical protein